MFVSAFCTLPVAQAQTPPSISDVPLFLNEGVAPLNMIVLGRDHKLYYEAYNDASDLDGDGTLDIRYKPARSTTTAISTRSSATRTTPPTGVSTRARRPTTRPAPAPPNGAAISSTT